MMRPFYRLKDMDLKGRTVLLRVDFNVSIEKNRIADDTKIRATLPTIRHILKRKPKKLILMTHLGRPKGRKVPGLKTDRLAKRLSSLLKKPVKKVDRCFGIDADKIKGQIIMLENLRFHRGEKENSPGFAKKLAKLAQVYVNDAFGVCHRKHASVIAVTKYLPSCAGLLLEKELQMYDLLRNPRRPFILLLGGKKLETKMPMIRSLLPKVDYILLGSSLGTHALDRPGNRWMLKKRKIIFPEDYKGEYDIGKKTVGNYTYFISSANTICWNGPVGKFEKKRYETGTKKLAKAIAKNRRATTVIGGGSTIEAARKYRIMDKVTHASTGGGASLMVWQGNILPAMKALQQNYKQQHL